MSALRDIDDLNKVAEKIGGDHQPTEELQPEGGGDGDGGHRLLLSKSRRAMHELASALERDSASWQSEREAWAQERASLQATMANKDSYVVMLKKETKRLLRVVGDNKHENERLESEALRLREDNADLLARNARLAERNLEVRRQAQTLAERNRKLKATIERDLLGDVHHDPAACNRSSDKSSGKRAAGASAAASSAVDRKPFGSAAPAPVAPAAPVPAVRSSRLTEKVESILVPNPRCRPVETVAPGPSDRSSSGGSRSSRSSSSSRSTRRLRKLPQPSDHSDTEEIVTPKSTAPGGGYDSMGAALAAAAALRVRPQKAALHRGGGVKNGWRRAVEEVEAAHSAQGRWGLAGAPSIAPTPPVRRSVNGDHNGREGELVAGDGGGLVVKREVLGASRGTVLLADRCGRGDDSPSVFDNPAREPDVPGRRPARSECSGSSDSSGSGSSRGISRSSRVHLSSSTPVNKPSRRDGGPGPPRSSAHLQPAPFSAALAPTPAAPEQAPVPADLPSSASKPHSSSSSSGRKRSRLSLGVRAADDRRPHNAVARAVEITEVLETPRPRSTAAAAAAAEAAAAAASEVEARHAPPEPPGVLDSGGPAALPENLVSREGGAPAGGARRRTNRNGDPERGERVSTVGPSRDGGSGRAEARVRVPKGERSKDGNLKGEGHDHDASGRDHDRQNGGTSLTAVAAAARGGGEEGGGWLLGVGSGNRGGGGGGESSGAAAAAPANEVTYPCLTMAVVKSSPKRKKQRKTQGRQQQQEDAAAVHHSRSSSNDSRSYGRQAGGQRASAGPSDRSGEHRQLSPPPRSSGRSCGGGTEDGSSGRKGRGLNAGDPREEIEHLSRENLAAVRENGGDRGALRPPRREPDETASNRGYSRGSGGGGGGGGGGGKELVGPVGEEQAAGVVAPPDTRHQHVPNPYATEAFSGGRGEGGSRERPRPNGKRPAVGYKFQEVVRDRSKRAMMKGHDCEHCRAYLAAVGGSPGEREAMLDMCSRHKYTEANGRPADTPEGFWDLSFADSINPEKELQQQQRRRQEGGSRNVNKGKVSGDDCSLGF